MGTGVLVLGCLAIILAGSIAIAFILLRNPDLTRELNEVKRDRLRERVRRENCERLLSQLYTEARSRADVDEVAAFFVDLIETENRKMNGVIINQ